MGVGFLFFFFFFFLFRTWRFGGGGVFYIPWGSGSHNSY